jgi:hypothetical protein
MAVQFFLFLILDLIHAPQVVSTDRGAIVVSDKRGALRWKAEWTMDPVEEQGQRRVRFTEKGRGRVSPFQEEIQWSLQAVWSAEDVFQPLYFEKTINAVSGEHLVTERKRFDHGGKTVRFERQSTGGPSETKSLSIQSDTLAVEGIAGILRFFPFQQSMPLAVHLLSNEPRVYRVTFENRGKEVVKTPAGEFECYKLELVPHLGVLDVFRMLYPKTYFWFTVNPPHFWVRYEGPENGPHTPQVVMELDRNSN